MVRVPLADLESLIAVLGSCEDNFCSNRLQNQIDLRTQYLRFSALRDEALGDSAPDTVRARRHTTEIVEVDARSPNRKNDFR